MFCPQCSQEQVNPENRFCSRCGFHLGDILEALNNDGFVDRNISASINGLRLRVSIGLVMIALSLVFFIASLVIGTPEPSYVIQLNLLVTLIVFLIGLAWIGYSLWRGFDVGTAHVHDRSPRSSGSADAVTAQLERPNAAALREGYVAPATVDKDRELASSVTENTTKFLEQDRGL